MRRALPRGWKICSCSACDRRAYSGSTGAGRVALAQRFGRFADLALARQEHQHVAGAVAGAFVDRVDDGVDQVAFLVARHALAVAARPGGRGLVLGGFLAHRTVAHLDRIQPARDLDHRRRLVLGRGEMAGEALGVDGGRGDDDFQVGTARQQLLEIAQQEVDVQAAFVRLVDDDGVVAAQERSRCDSASRMPSVISLIDALGPVRSLKRTW